MNYRRMTRPCLKCGGVRTCRWIELPERRYWLCNRCSATWTAHDNLTLYTRPRAFSDVQVREAERGLGLL